MANVTVSIYFNNSFTKKNGMSRFYIQVILNRKIKRIPLNLHIDPQYYNPKTKGIKEVKGAPNPRVNNLYLKEKQNEVEQIIIDLERKKQAVTFTNIVNYFENKQVNDSFIEFARSKLIEERNQIKKSHYEGLELKITLLERYQPHLTTYEIDEGWLETYRNYLIETLNYKQNTVYGTLSMIRKFVTIAFKKSIIKSSPFTNFSFEKEDIQKSYLTLDELDKLHNLYSSKHFLGMTKQDERGKTYLIGDKHHETLQHILISCYCGLRLSDLRNLRYKHIQENMMILPMGKSRKGKEKTLRIPLTEKLLSVLDIDETKKPNDKIYSGFVRNSTDINTILRFIMKEIDISKYLTFHSTRHTFAVSSLTLGMSIETVSDILGHNDLRTTQIYAKVIDDKRKEEMSKWDKLINKQTDNLTHTQVMCPKCENIVMSFEKEIIKLNKLSLECQYCSTDFTYSLSKKMTIQLKKAL
jgi:integrase